MIRLRLTTGVALVLWVVWLLLVIAAAAMKALDWHGAGNTSGTGLLALFVAYASIATVGMLVAIHVPRNPVGWMLLAMALGAAGAGAAENYAYHGLLDAPGSVPAAMLVAWFFLWGWFPTVSLVAIVPLLFPTGTVPGPRWRPVLWVEIAFVAVVTALFMFNPGPLDDGPRPLPDNPVGLGFLAGVNDHLDAVLGVGILGMLGVAAVAMIVRFRRSRGDERQQLKLMVVAAVVLLTTIAGPDIVGIADSGDVIFSLGVLQLPVAIGVAMFRYRLYDVDRLINRALVYAVLTALLGGAYAGLVLAGQWLSSSFTGGGSLAVAVSTLAVAALFLPLRARVQRFVDRRFYRRRYDAQRTLGSFGARMREQVELDALVTELAGVVETTVQPAHAGVWLRTAGGGG